MYTVFIDIFLLVVVVAVEQNRTFWIRKTKESNKDLNVRKLYQVKYWRKIAAPLILVIMEKENFCSSFTLHNLIFYTKLLQEINFGFNFKPKSKFQESTVFEGKKISVPTFGIKVIATVNVLLLDLIEFGFRINVNRYFRRNCFQRMVPQTANN